MITEHLSLAAFIALLLTVVGCNSQSAVSQQTAAQIEPDGDAENMEPQVVSEKPKVLKSVMQFDVEVGGTSAGGLTSDGKTLWISAQSMRDDILLQYTTEGKFLKRVALGRAGNISGGLAYDGQRVLVLDYRTKYSGGGAIFRLGEKENLVRVVDFPTDLHNTFGLPRLETPFTLVILQQSYHQPRSMRSNLMHQFTRLQRCPSMCEVWHLTASHSGCRVATRSTERTRNSQYWNRSIAPSNWVSLPGPMELSGDSQISRFIG